MYVCLFMCCFVLFAKKRCLCSPYAQNYNGLFINISFVWQRHMIPVMEKGIRLPWHVTIHMIVTHSHNNIYVCDFFIDKHACTEPLIEFCHMWCLILLVYFCCWRILSDFKKGRCRSSKLTWSTCYRCFLVLLHGQSLKKHTFFKYKKSPFLSGPQTIFKKAMPSRWSVFLHASKTSEQKHSFYLLFLRSNNANLVFFTQISPWTTTTSPVPPSSSTLNWITKKLCTDFTCHTNDMAKCHVKLWLM